MPSSKGRTLIVWSFWAIVGGLVCPQVTAMDGNGDATVIIFHDGREISPDPRRSEVLGLIELVEEQLRGADGVLRLAVSDDLVPTLQSQEGIEVRYAEVRTFQLERLGRPVEVRRLFIPLSGELAGTITTMFVGDETRYHHGPYRNQRGTEELSRAVTALGMPRE